MSFATGTELGPYELLAKIGEGGMGEVWKARDTRLDRIVAIKRLKGEHSARFQQEARAIAALNHPHICQIYDVGPDYLVLEYVEGQPLQGPIPLERALNLALQVVSALEVAHRCKILHRDLKPANILVTESGVKLLDFGLAKLIANADATETVDGAVVGTAAYMSPEQAQGKPADERSDIFSFGAVLYELLSGRKAFLGDSMLEMLNAVVRVEPEPLQSPLEPIIKRCLAKQSKNRFQTAAELRAALEQCSHAKPVEQRPSIAVLPFANMSGDPENAYFGDGLAEEIINAVTKLPGLRVVARASAFRFRGEPDLRKIGDALRVETVLEGSVRRAGNRLRVTAQLIHIADDSQIWSERYDREMTDIFLVQDEISQAIVDVLKVRLAPNAGQPLVPRKTASIDAYNAYLEGRYHFQQLTEASLAQSRICFERAIASDLDFAPPHAGLAEYYLYWTLYHATPARETITKAQDAIERAIQLDPGAAEGYIARGVLRGPFQYDWKAAGADFDKALQLNPESSIARYRRAIWSLMPLGRLDEAIADLQRAVELDPVSMLTRGVEAYISNLAGLRETAIQRARSTIELFPSSFLACFLCAFPLAAHGFLEESRGILQRGLQFFPRNAYLKILLTAVEGRMGNTRAVARALEELKGESGEQYIPCLVHGLAHAVAGDLDAAFRMLDLAIEERQPWTMTFLVDPLFRDLLCHDPRYAVLMKRMNVELLPPKSLNRE